LLLIFRLSKRGE
jgi:hypothetical protein